MIRFACPNCEKPVVASPEMLGKRVKCPNCLGTFVTKGVQQETAREPAEAAAEHTSEKISTPVLILGGVAVGVLFVAVGLVAYMLGHSSSDHRSVAAIDPTATVDPPRQPVPTPIAATVDPPVTPAGEKLEPSRTPTLEVPPADLRSDDSEIEALIARIERSVVTIEVDGEIGGQRHHGTGSGFIVDSAGALVTNFHVVEGAISAKVVFSDNSETPVLGFRTLAIGKDLAVLAIDPQSVTAAPLKIIADSPKKGSRVYALGSPKGFKGTVSDGVVSALRRGEDLSSTDSSDFASFFFDLDANWIQTSAPISQGNSGGPLINRAGELVGVNTWINLKGQNLNFAISASHVRELVSVRSPIKRLSELPAGPQAAIALAAKKAESRDEAARAERLSKLQSAEARENADREAAREASARRASEEKAESDSRIAVQLELNRMNDRMITVKNELRIVESQGEELTRQRADVFAKGQAVFARGNQLKEQIIFGRNRLGVLANVIRSRDLTAKGGPNFLDGEPGSTAQLRQEVINIEANIPVLMREAGPLEAIYLGLDQQARALGGQIEAKVAERSKLSLDLKELERQYGELLGKTPGKAEPQNVAPSPFPRKPRSR